MTDRREEEKMISGFSGKKQDVFEDAGKSSRYLRQMSLPEIGEEGQKKLKDARVLVIGAGGLGSPVLLYMAAAGIGKIGILDGDIVEESNLNRQILYHTEDIGHLKAFCAASALKKLNREIEVTPYGEMLTEKNAEQLIGGYDLAVFCLDSMKTRKIANRACVHIGVPFVEGGVSEFFGVITTVIPHKTACIDCIHPYDERKKETDASFSVLGAMSGIVGCIQALAAIRLLLGQNDPSQGALIYIDGRTLTIQKVPVLRNPGCPSCGEKSPGSGENPECKESMPG